MRTNTKSNLSDPIVYEGDSIKDIFDNGMNHFYHTFLKKEIKPKYKGKDIFFDMDKMYKRMYSMPYPLSFMHITSLDEEDKYSLYPCTNDISMEMCINHCDLDAAMLTYGTYGRWECIYRLSRIHWIPEVIELANQDDKDITVFSEEKTDGRKKYNMINIRYCSGMDDYLIVLKERKQEGDYLFVTAMPVVTKAKKRRLEKSNSSKK